MDSSINLHDGSRPSIHDRHEVGPFGGILSNVPRPFNFTEWRHRRPWGWPCSPTTLGRDAIGKVLFSVDPHDPVIFMAVVMLVMLVTLVALLATSVPARRATRVDPMTALRAE